METEGKGCSSGATETSDFVLKWGNRKRLRCMKVKKELNHNSSPDCLGKKKKKNASRSVSVETQFSPPRPHRLNKNSMRRTSPEKEDRYYSTRGSNGMDCHIMKEEKMVWPRLFTTLSSKEKEEDFMAMKGCKLPQRPKKRAKLIQRSLIMVSPGAWLPDLCEERYEIMEKKSSKKKPRGLKAMESESDE